MVSEVGNSCGDYREGVGQPVTGGGGGVGGRWGVNILNATLVDRLISNEDY